MASKIWYHGTSEECFKQIQKDERLLGKQLNGKRHTSLCLDRDEASLYGEVTLRVEYDPVMDLDNNNFNPDSLEIRVSTPIHKSKDRKSVV